MEWINLHTSSLDSPHFLGAEPVCRATWLCLLRYAVGQEMHGRIPGARTWGDRKWQQLCRVTLAEVQCDCDLWTWEGDDLVVAFYPLEQEAEVLANRRGGAGRGRVSTPAKAAAARENGKLGGRPKTHEQTQDGFPGTEDETHGGLENPREGKEREGKEGETQDAQPTPPLSGGSLASPYGELERLAAIRAKDPQRYQAAMGDLSTAAAIEVLRLADPKGIWPSCLEEARVRWNAGRSERRRVDHAKVDRAREAKRLAQIEAERPAQLELAQRILAFLDSNPSVVERLDKTATNRVDELRKATAAGKASFFVHVLIGGIPELRDLRNNCSTGNGTEGA